MSTPVRTTCPYCGVGCGVLATATSQGIDVRGDPSHPANRGALCSKGAALGDTVGLAGRLLTPRVRGADTDWETALSTVATEFGRIIQQHGPDAVALYVSGQLLTEDYYVANKLMKGYVGSANIDTNSRLCMSSAVAAHRRAFGEDLVPVSYEDLELADLVLLVGSNLAWCHPVLYQRLVRTKASRPNLRIVVVDPRRTASCDVADLHLPIRAGTDVWLFNGLLHWLAHHAATDAGFISEHTRGASRALTVAHNTAGDVGTVARRCGLQVEDLTRFYEWFAGTQRVVSVFSQGVNQSSSGTDKANALINCHLLTGRIGRPGMGPFSITGQPNAMGGREVGGLSNMLAAHLDLERADHRGIVQGFWRSPTMAERPGLKAVDLFEAIHQGRVKAVWIMATNPVVSMPNADRTVEALRRCECVVVSDCIADTDTTRLAQVLLPAAAWSEKDGTVTNSDRHISRQRRVRAAPGLARPDWWIICQVAQRLGFGAGFSYKNPAEIFREHAQLSCTHNAGDRAFDLGALSALSDSEYEDLESTPWPAPLGRPAGTARLFGDARFYHADGRARFIAVRPQGPRHAVDLEYPLSLNTGRIRDQWHTMTRTGLSARLSSHLPEPYVDLHAADALSFGLRQDSLVRVSTRWGSLVARLRISGESARGSVFIPIHWSDTHASDARVGALINPVVDPVSGEPEFKHTPARIEPFVVTWHGVCLSLSEIRTESLLWWARAQGPGFQRLEFAARSVPRDWSVWAHDLLGAPADADWLEYLDTSTGSFRAAWLLDGRLQACLYIAARPSLPSRSWMASLFEKGALDASDRISLLSGRPLEAAQDAGETVCACFGVGRKTIARAIAQGCSDPAAIGQRIKAGTNCGSCVPELRRLIQEAKIA